MSPPPVAMTTSERHVEIPWYQLASHNLGERVRSRVIIVQRKTGRPVQFELLEPARASILAWLARQAVRWTTSPSRAG
jgi:hypothetical protein